MHADVQLSELCGIGSVGAPVQITYASIYARM